MSIARLSTGASQLPLIDLAGWTEPAPERRFAWGNWIPLRRTTMLTGAGGVGKSLIVQMLLTCMSLGLPFLGMETRQAACLYVTAEDDAEELWRRQRAICDSLRVTMDQVRGHLHLVSLAGEADTALATLDSNGRMVATSRWHQVRASAEALGVRYAAFDTATDMLAGDHNDIHQVAAFVNLLTGLAIDRDGATLILHHPSKGGDDWLGSVAWHNKVRSRLIIKRPDGPDPDARTIENPKANYGPSGSMIDFRWHAGAFVRDDDLPPDAHAEIKATIAASSDNLLFLACLAERTVQRRAVSEKRRPTFAPTEFAKMAESKGIGKERLDAAMDRLFRTRQIERAELWKGDDRKPIFGLRETAGDGAVNTMRDTRETVRLPSQNSAGDAANAHSPL